MEPDDIPDFIELAINYRDLSPRSHLEMRIMPLFTARPTSDCHESILCAEITASEALLSIAGDPSCLPFVLFPFKLVHLFCSLLPSLAPCHCIRGPQLTQHCPQWVLGPFQGSQRARADLGLTPNGPLTCCLVYTTHVKEEQPEKKRVINMMSEKSLSEPGSET